MKPENRTDFAEPGESALIHVETAPNSFVGMLAMDQSLLLLKSGNDITESDVRITTEKKRENQCCICNNAYLFCRLLVPSAVSIPTAGPSLMHLAPANSNSLMVVPYSDF